MDLSALAGLFIWALTLHYGEALKCRKCSYLQVDSNLSEGSKDCNDDYANVALDTCSGTAQSGYEFRCIKEDVEYKLLSAKYTVVSRGCVRFSTSVEVGCSSDTTSSLWKEYSTQYKSGVAGLANFLTTVESIKGDVCTCKGDDCNEASHMTSPTLAAMLVWCIMGYILH